MTHRERWATAIAAATIGLSGWWIHWRMIAPPLTTVVTADRFARVAEVALPRRQFSANELQVFSPPR